jgi:methyl-accepting chemotaxis protein
LGRLLLSLAAAAVLAGVLGAQAAPTYFWDDPQPLVRQGARFPVAVDNGKTAAAFWQERRQTEGWPQSFLSVTVRNQGDAGWTTRRNILGPFTLIGSEAQIYSVALTQSGVFWVAVLGEEDQVILYESTDGAATFREERRLTAAGNLLVPKLFLGPGDEPILMVNQADAATFRIYSSRRVGGQWTNLQLVTDETDQRQSFQPAVTKVGDRLVMVYQTLFTGQRITYQIFRKDSFDGGATWGTAQRLSNFADDLAENPDLADNERPSVSWFQNRLFVSWERRTAQTQSAVEIATYSPDGRRLDAQALTSNGFTARNPLFYTFQDKLRLAWFDNRNETYDLFLSAWDPDLGWDTPERLTKETGNSVFGQPARLGDDLYFFWQNSFGDNPGVSMLQPLRHVGPPILSAVNFKPGVRTNNPVFTVDVAFPRDPSGIQGLNSLLTQDPAAEPAHERRFTSQDRRQTVTVPEEGLWYLAVTVEDGAGNWSAAVRVPLTLKTTPPGPVVFDSPATDARGFLTSNTFRLTWKPSTGDAVAYSWRLTRVGDSLTQNLLASLKTPEPGPSPTGTEASAGGDNWEDGLWALSVAAFDDAGNRGPVSTRYFRMNKFQPYTVIHFVDIRQDVFGRAQIAIHGRGFTAGGALDHVYIDRDGRPPFDYDLGPGRFHLASDQLVDGIQVDGLAEGVYRVGVSHPERGVVFTGPVLTVGPAGTVKIGDYRNLDQTAWEFFLGITFFFSVHAVYFWAVMALLAAAALGSGRLLASALAERARIDRQASAWFADTTDKWARGAGRTFMKTKGRSLTFKFATSILGLTGTVILMLALTLGFFITENSQRTLGTALQQRTQVLLESLATGARTYLPTANYQELGNLPQQISAMEGDALYATITGPSTEKKAGLSYVYASNDPDLKSKTDTPTLIPGVTLLRDRVEPLWAALQKDLEKQAEAAVGDMARQIESLSKQALPLATKNDAVSRAQVKQYDDQISLLKRQVIAKLAEIGGKARSFPAFDTQNLLGSQGKRYLFYQPFLYQTLGDPTYVRGLIRIEVSSLKIEQQITASRDQLIFVTFLIALVALGLGLVGALLLSAITINPIRKLVTGVEKIRDTDDKTQLEGHVIQLNTGDELSDLARSINEMTRGLVDGASRTQDLTKGKIEQKTLFIPLDKDSENQKLTTFHRDLPEIEVFAYYEGAKLVSGDLYEFRQLDNEKNAQSPWYGIMKGDVSGKGVEAGMIMAIAAMFVTTFFRRWTEAKDGKNTKVDALLFQINDTIEPILAEAGRGLFVALNVGVLNAKTGHLRFGTAGDNILHVWRGRQQRYELVDLKKTISVGAMPSFLHNIRYENRDLVLEAGDTLLYFTDGIEESQSEYRDADFLPVSYFDPEDAGTVAQHGARKQVQIEGGPVRDVQAQGTEDFGPERMEAVITAFYRREVYELKKKNPPIPGLAYHFDFSSCDGSSKQLVTALISVDRIFRLVPDPKATADDRIQLDLVQDEFLKRHFVQYDRYFRNGYQLYEKADPSTGSLSDSEGYKLVDGKRVLKDPAYIWYDHLKEDHQFDDLTLLAIRKK